MAGSSQRALGGLDLLEHVGDIDRLGHRSGAGGRASQSVIFDARVVAGQHGVGEEAERQDDQTQPGRNGGRRDRRRMRSAPPAARRHRTRCARSGTARTGGSRPIAGSTPSPESPADEQASQARPSYWRKATDEERQEHQKPWRR